MIEEVAVVSILGGVGLTIADKFNAFGWNPEQKWFWERSPFVQAPPAARISQQAVQAQPHLTGEQQLAEARRSVIYSEQLLASVSNKFPSLAVTSKYALSSRPQQQQFIEPYRPKTYP